MTAKAKDTIEFIVEPLRQFAVPIDDLTMMEHNPRRGSVDRLATLLQEFGQRLPLVARRTNGRLELEVGNHRWLAAQQLGWTHLAVLVCDDEDDLAWAFSLAENQSHDIGTYDSEALAAFVAKIESPDLRELAGYGPLDMDAILSKKPDMPPASEPVGAAGYVWVNLGRLQARVKGPAYKARVAEILAEHNGDETAASVHVAKLLGFGPGDLVLA